jgi:hypothetical protein
VKSHVTVLGVIHIALGSLGLLAAGIVFVAVFGGGLISGDPHAMFVTSIVGGSIAAFLGLLSLPGVICGFGLIKLKSWARVLALVLAVLNLPNVPLGTALGIYSFWVLLNQETELVFSGKIA